MLREHDYHVPSVDTGENISDDNSWQDFLDRVDANDRSLFTEGIDLKHTTLPPSKPEGVVGQLYEARQGTPISPIIDTLWSYGGVAPMSLVSNENGLLPKEVSGAIGHGITGILEITSANEVKKMLHEASDDNPNMSAIVTAMHEGHMEPTQQVVVSRPLASFYSENRELVAD